MKNLSIVSLILISLLFTGCDQTTSTLGGAAIGTGMGAIVGNAIGGDTGSTALGAVLGGLAGAAIGSNEGAKRNPQPKKTVVVEEQVPVKVVSRPATRVIHHETRVETIRPVHVVSTPVVRETVIVKEQPRIIVPQPAVVVHQHTVQPKPQNITHTHTTINKTVHNNISNTFCEDEDEDDDYEEEIEEDDDEDDEDDDY